MKNVRKVSVALMFSAAIFSFGCQRMAKRVMDLPPPDYKKLVAEKNVMVSMRDGVKLATDIYRPKTDGKLPAVLIRIPYGKDTMSIPCKAFAKQGYVCIAQDCRGAFASEGGIFFPLFHEAPDGMDTVKWIEKQPWFDGNLGAWGGSYFGYTQWAIADNNDTLKAFYPLITTPRMTDMTYIGGALQYELAKGWASSVGHQAERRAPDKNAAKTGNFNIPLQPPPGIDLKTLAFHINDPAALEKQLGITLPDGVDPNNPDSLPEELVTGLTDNIIKLFNYPKLLRPHKEWGWGDYYKDVSAPALSVAGWYDIFVGTQLEDHMRLVREGKGNAKYSRLIVGPWGHGHADNFITKGDKSVSFKGMIREFSHVEWFDYWLKGEQNDVPDWPPIRIYVMGANKWRNEREWPLARTKYTDYYVHSNGDAATAAGAGLLNVKAPAANEPPDKYDYDPSNPVPTSGGCNLISNIGPAYQNELEQRPDVLVFTSDTLSEDAEVTGPITGVIYASSSAVDTDFTMKLVDVYPDGKAVIIQDGVIRARYRDSETDPSLIVPGKIYKYDLNLWATSNAFLKGHRIRVEISSSNFPRFEPNSNLGGKGGPDDHVTAHQTIYHDAEHPTRITLPIIP